MTESAFGDTFPPFDGTADTLVRSIVTYLVESTDTPDDTPQRLERTLGIALRPSHGANEEPLFSGAAKLVPPWMAFVSFTPPHTPDPAFTVWIRERDEGDADSHSTVVSNVEFEEIASTLRERGFQQVPRFGLHGGFEGGTFLLGGLRVNFDVEAKSATQPTRLVITHVSADWARDDDRSAS